MFVGRKAIQEVTSFVILLGIVIIGVGLAYSVATRVVDTKAAKIEGEKAIGNLDYLLSVISDVSFFGDEARTAFLSFGSGVYILNSSSIGYIYGYREELDSSPVVCNEYRCEYVKDGNLVRFYNLSYLDLSLNLSSSLLLYPGHYIIQFENKNGVINVALK